MLDLSQETLIPLVTKAKCRGGAVAVFVCSTNGGAYRWVKADHEGSFTTDIRGEYITSSPSPRDIISIAKKWHPKNHERVIVLGYAEHTEGDGAFNLTGKKCVVRDDDLPALGYEGYDANLVKVYCYPEDMCFLVAICQLRRHVAPPATEEPLSGTLSGSNFSHATVDGRVYTTGPRGGVGVDDAVHGGAGSATSIDADYQTVRDHLTGGYFEVNPRPSFILPESGLVGAPPDSSIPPEPMSYSDRLQRERQYSAASLPQWTSVGTLGQTEVWSLSNQLHSEPESAAEERP